MIGLNVKIDGDKVLLNGLERFAREIPEAVQEGLGEIVDLVHIEAIANLQGPRRGMKTKTAKKSGRKRAVVGKPELAGGYPVPRASGNLLRLLDRVKPGKSKSSNGLTFRAGHLEAIIFNSAEYADVIHGGRGSSEKYGERPFISDAVKTVTPEMAHIMSKSIMEKAERI